MGVDGGLRVDGRGPCGFRQAGVAGAADLDGAVVDELRDQQAGRRRRRSLRRSPARGRSRRSPWSRRVRPRPRRAARCRSTRPSRRRPSTPSGRSRRPDPAQQAAGARIYGLRPAQQPLRPALPAPPPVRPGAQRDGLRPDQDAVDPAVHPPRPADCQLRQRCPAAPPRCYHRASLSPLVLRGLPRAREGLFLAPIPVLAGRLLFRLSPLHDNPFTLRPCHAASL